MVSFRFHLVSLVAVFLALALGIGMGATVIDKATVDSLKRRVAAVQDERNAANQQVSDLNRQLTRSNAWEVTAQEYLTSKRLDGVPVTILAIRGVDQGQVTEQRKTLQAAGAGVQGVLWFTSKGGLTQQQDVVALQNNLGAASPDEGQLRQAFLARISAVLAGASPADVLQTLQRAGFLEWEAVAVENISDANLAASRLLLASGSKAEVPNDELAIPLTKLLAVQPARRLVAIESGRDADARTNTSGERAVFLDALRRDGALDGKLSTVDNVESSQGRVASVLALSQLPDGRTGDYGVADSAEGPLPKLNP